MVHNTSWLVLFVWLFCTVSANADRHEPDGVGDGNGWESTVGDERIISPELAWRYFDTDWDIGLGIHESDRAADDWRQSNRDWDLFSGFELCNSELFELAHDSCVDWYRCDKPCVVVYHSEGCFENWKDSERFGERIMIERDLMYLAMAFVAGVVCHRFVMAAFKQLFGWINK